MPWSEVSSMDQRKFLIDDYINGDFTITELAARFGVSRKTAYKWIGRFEEEGRPGLSDRSRRPASCPSQTPGHIVDEILALRRRHPLWGAKKLLAILSERRPQIDWPSRSTVCDLLKRNGMVQAKRRRTYPGHPGQPTTSFDAPNGIWCADFKGEFKTGDGYYCYPLTVTDGFSRYLLGCKGLYSTAHEGTKPLFRRLFQDYGMPLAIRTDNGAPFATTALSRLSRLSVWWIRLGIFPELIEPGCPQQNGRHERMHRTLKAHTARPPASSLRSQQRRFNDFLVEYNELRPHEALGMKPPVSVYRPSQRQMPSRLPEVTYPDHFEVRLVSNNGGIRWNSRWVNISHVLKKQYVGLEEVGDGIFDVHFGFLRLGRFDCDDYKLEDALGRKSRKKVLPMSSD
ncbi:MAG TPA: IS481 family transposase [Actinomycetota bacterium]|nr:IS481 family transposase [Actinomycetota bacterium]